MTQGGEKITSVGDGEIAEGSTDAVNGGQVYSLAQDVSDLTKDMSGFSSSISELGDRVNEVGAGAAALAALHPFEYDPMDKFNVAVGYGNYKNANAAAVGLSYRPNEKTMFNVGFTMGNGNDMVNAGMSFRVGSGTTVSSKAELAARVAEQNKEIAGLNQEVARLNAKDAERDAQMQELMAQVAALRAGK